VGVVGKVGAQAEMLNPSAKLSYAQVRRIHALNLIKLGHARIAAEFGISPCTVSRICRGRFWPTVHAEFRPIYRLLSELRHDYKTEIKSFRKLLRKCL
jgi:hypothetical protein